VTLQRRAAGLLRLRAARAPGGRGPSNLDMASWREHLNRKPIGLHRTPRRISRSSATSFAFPAGRVRHIAPRRRRMIEPAYPRVMSPRPDRAQPRQRRDVPRTTDDAATTATTLGHQLRQARSTPSLHVATPDTRHSRGRRRARPSTGHTAVPTPTDLPGVEVFRSTLVDDEPYAVPITRVTVTDRARCRTRRSWARGLRASRSPSASCTRP